MLICMRKVASIALVFATCALVSGCAGEKESSPFTQEQLDAAERISQEFEKPVPDGDFSQQISGLRGQGIQLSDADYQRAVKYSCDLATAGKDMDGISHDVGVVFGLDGEAASQTAVTAVRNNCSGAYLG